MQATCCPAARAAVFSLLAISAVLAFGAGHPRQNPDRVKEIAAMLADEPGFPAIRVENRALWDRAPKHWIKAGEAALAEKRETIDETHYLEVKWPEEKFTSAFSRIILAELVENKGRFLPAIVLRLENLCKLHTWMNPYHDRNGFGNFHGKYRSIDLNSGAISLTMALAMDAFRDKLPQATKDRVMAAFKLFIIDPYLRTARDDKTYDCWRNAWFFGHSNWNAACHWQSAVLALSCIKDKTTRAEFIEGAERGMPYFLGGFSKEGYCQEGLDYWNYGFGEFMRLTHVVCNATQGRVDFSKMPKARACFAYPTGFQLANGTSPQFNDGTASVASRHTLYLGEFFWPDLRSDATNGMTPFDLGFRTMMVVLPRPDALTRRSLAAPARLPLRTWFEDAGIFVARPSDPGLYTLSACIKGGWNDVPHNHNDAGQFIIALGDTQMVQDPAGKVYDLETFTSKRYNHPMLNSYGHAVPLPGGTLQAAGHRAAKVVETSFTDAKDTIVFDLKPTYTNRNLLALTRTFVYDRVAQTVTLTDKAAFRTPDTYESPLTTYGTVVKRGDGGYTIVRKTDLGTKRLDFTVAAGGAKWHAKEEKIPNPKRTEPTRWAVVADSPAADHEITFVFSRGDNPPDLDWTVGLETGNPEKGPWQTNWFHAARQKLAVTKLGDGRWRFTCSRFRGFQRTMAVDFRLDVEVKDGKTVASGSLKNLEGGTQMFVFKGPFVRAARVERGKSEFLYPWSNGSKIVRWPEADDRSKPGTGWGYFLKKCENGVWDLKPQLRTEYPSRRCMMQWYALTDGKTTRYLSVKDPKFSAKQAVVEFDPSRSTLRFGFNQRFYAHTGETVELARTEVLDYAGDWHRAADDYGAWFTSVRPFAYVPDKVRDCSTLMLLLCKQQNGEIVWPYGDFAALGDTALKYGIRHIKILARGPGGHDNRYPDYYPDPAQGGTNAFMKGLAELKKRGIETYAYVNGQLIECGTTDYWKTGGGSTAGVLCRDGTRAHEAWLKYTDKPAHEFDVACPCDRTWLAKMMEVTKEAQYLGFNGMYFDQVAKQWPWQCWAKNHGHRPGDWVWVEDRARYLKGIHDEMVKYDPEFILTSEGYNETVSDSCSISLGLGDSSSIARRFDPEAKDYKFCEMAFYAFPRLRTSDRYPSPHRSRTDINETAIAGYAADIEVRYPADRVVFEQCRNQTKADYGTVNWPPISFDKALLSGDLKADRDYFKAVNDFRYANREIILRGDYRDTTGFAVQTYAKNWMAKRWVSKDGTRDGILVWNADSEPHTFTVTAARGLLVSTSEPEKGCVKPGDAIPANALRLYVYAKDPSTWQRVKAWWSNLF